MADDTDVYDCMLLYDSERGSLHIKDTINEIKHYMKDVSIHVDLPQKMLPSDDVINKLASGLMTADVAIVLIDSEPSPIFSDLISRAFYSERLHVIPLFCNISEEKMKQMVIKNLPILSNTDPRLNSGNYLERLNESITAEKCKYNQYI